MPTVTRVDKTNTRHTTHISPDVEAGAGVVFAGEVEDERNVVTKTIPWWSRRGGDGGGKVATDEDQQS